MSALLLTLVLCIVLVLSPAHVGRVVDGDTFDFGPMLLVEPKLVFDGGTLWPSVYSPAVRSPLQRVRVLGVDAIERPVRPKTWVSRDDSLAKWSAYSDSLARFFAATDSTAAWLTRGPSTLKACTRDNFGRFLAWLNRGTDSLHVVLINAGLGVRP